MGAPPSILKVTLLVAYAGRVYSLEERWEQLPLLSVAQISRRINGFLSCTFSPFLL